MKNPIKRGGSPFPKETQKKPLSKDTKSLLGMEDKTGPYVDGFRGVAIDLKKTKKKNFFTPHKFSENTEKNGVKPINNFMNKNKSKFDKLFEDVMNDEEALGVDPENVDSEMVDDVEPGVNDGMDEDVVTVTLDRGLAQQLLDALHQVVGDVDVDSENLEDVGDESDLSDNVDDEDLDDGDEFKEGVEIEELKGVEDLKDKSKMKVSTRWSPKKGNASGKSTDKVGNDGDLGHAGPGHSLSKGQPANKKAMRVDSTNSKLAGSEKSAFED